LPRREAIAEGGEAALEPLGVDLGVSYLYPNLKLPKLRADGGPANCRQAPLRGGRAISSCA
jgi:hypothetical protein